MNKKGAIGTSTLIILGFLLVLIILSGSGIVRWINPSFFTDFDIFAGYWIAFIQYWVFIIGFFYIMGFILWKLYQNKNFLIKIYSYISNIVIVR